MKMRALTGKLLAVTLILLPVSTFGVATVSATSPATPPSTTLSETLKIQGLEMLLYQDGLLTVTAKDADLRQLLEAVGEKAGVAFHIDRGVQGKVSVEFSGKGIQDALGVILGKFDGNNFLTGYDRREKIQEIWVLPKGTDAAVTEEDLRLRRWSDEDKRYFKEKYGSLIRAVCEVFGKIYGKRRWDSWEWNPAFDRPPSLSGEWTVGEETFASEETALAFGRSFIKTYENLLQTRVEDLRINPRLTKRGPSAYRFVFDQYVNGVPVERGVAGMSVSSTGFSLTNATLPDVRVSTTPRLSASEATALAVDQNEKYFLALKKRYGKQPALREDEKRRRGEGELVIFPVPSPSPMDGPPASYTYYLTYKVPFSEADYYIDAQTGSLILRASTVVQLTAGVSGHVYPDRTYTTNAANLAGSQEAPLANLNVRLNGNLPVHTDSAGQYTYNATDSVQLRLESTFDGGRDFLVVSEANGAVPWDVIQVGNYTFDVDTADGYRPTAYYWADKAFTWYFEHLNTIININESQGTRVRTTIRTNHAFDDPRILGQTGHNETIQFRPANANDLAGSIFPDVILHELSHAATYSKRGSLVAGSAYGPTTGGLDEGVADYFACRIADAEFFVGANATANFNIDLDPAGSEAKPAENVGAGVLDDRDWQHYGNGSVIAATLWDLKKSVVTDAILWESLKANWLTSYKPEALYNAVFGVATDPAAFGLAPQEAGSHLWDTFSAHSMNLLAKPNAGGGVVIDWYKHRSPTYGGYYVYRNATGTFDESSVPIMEGGVPKLFPIDTTSWEDLSASSSTTTYHYAVRAVSADGQVKSPFSNEASSKGEPSGGSPPAPPQNFKGEVTTWEGSTAVKLTWTASTSTDIYEYVIERALNEAFTTARLELRAAAGARIGYDQGGLTGPLGFDTDTKYYYRMKAVDQAGLSSTWILMNPTYVVPQPNPPAQPTDLKGRGGKGGAKFSWTAPQKNADGSDLTDLAGHRFYYSTGTNPRVGSIIQLAASVESKELTGLTNDTPYFVCVTAVDSVGNESACSDTVTVTPRDARWVHESGGPSGSFTEITDALAGAPNGTTVIVGEGQYGYPEGLIVGDDNGAGWNPLNITLRSERGPAKTKILTSQIEVGDKCRVIGFTLAQAEYKALNIYFDLGVLVANNIFVGNETAIFSGGADGYPSLERVNRIYNNVFAGNITGIDMHFSFNVTDIQNNIFQGTGSDHTAISLAGGCAKTFIHYNNFHGSGARILSDPYGDCAQIRSNSECDPRFERFPASNLLASDFHLAPDDDCAKDGGDGKLKYEGKPWEDCAEFGDNRYRADLGAYGGPFAYVDKNLNGIPDCSEPKGWPSSVAVLMNSANQPVTLAARNMDAGELTYNVTAPAAHGELAGVAPSLSYTVAPSYIGPDGLSFTVANAIGVSEPEQVSITVRESNTQPTAVDQSFGITKGHTQLIVLQGADADGDPLSFSVVSEPPSGSLVCLHPPECLYIPAEDTHGEMSFSYRAHDGIAESEPAAVTVLVNSEPEIALSTPFSQSWLPAPSASALFGISWQYRDADSATSSLSLYMDTDASDFDGTPIVTDLPLETASQDWQTGTYDWDVSALPEGAYYVYGVMRDEWSSSMDYAPRPLVVDHSAPVVTYSPAGGLYRTAQTVTFQSSEQGTKVHCTPDGSEPTTLSPNCTWGVLVDHSVTLRWIAVDVAGNQSAEGIAVYEIDTVPPSVGIDVVQDPMKQVQEFVVRGTRESDVTVSLAADPPVEIGPMDLGVSAAWSAIVRNVSVGPITFTVTARDAAGNTATASRTTTIYNQPPAISESYPKNSTVEISSDGSGLFWVEASDPDDPPEVLGYSWTLGGLPLGSGNTLNFNPGLEIADGNPRMLRLEVSDGFASAVRDWWVTVYEATLLDDVSCTYAPTESAWPLLTSASGYYGAGFRRSSGTVAGTATCTASLPAPGTYKVYARWPAASTHDATAVYRVTFADGKIDDLVVDQTTAGGQWNLLGTYSLGTTTVVNVFAGASDQTVVDAIRFVATSDPPDIVMDDADWQRPDGWDAYNGGFRGSSITTSQGQGQKFFTWTPQAVTAGTWDLSARWKSVSGGATNAKYVLSYDGDRSSQITVDQTALSGRWNPLGTFSFESADMPEISINDNANGTVVADALKLAYRDAGSVTIVDNDGDSDFNSSSGSPDRFGWFGSAWNAGDGAPGYLGGNFRQIGAGSGSCARWLLYLPQAGNYELYARWTSAADRSSAVRYNLKRKGQSGVSTTVVDQRTSGGQWNYLGRFACEQDDSLSQDPQSHETYLEVCQSADGVVAADAVLFARTDEDVPLIVDNAGTGGFSKSAGWASPTPLLPGHWGNNYFQTAAAGNTATWTATLATTGNYDVFARWTASSDRSTTAKYTIHRPGGAAEVTKNQQKNGGNWESLGRFFLEAGANSVELTSQGDGITVADAVRFDYTISPTNIVIDNLANESAFECHVVSGTWTPNTNLADFYSTNCQVHAAVVGGVIRWTPSIPLRAYYGVYVWWPPTTNLFSTAAPFKVAHAQAPQGETRTMDQRINGRKWNYLGTYLFEAGESGYVELLSTADGKVVADAVKFVAEGE